MWVEKKKSSVLKYVETPVSPCDQHQITGKMLIKESVSENVCVDNYLMLLD